MRPVIAGDNSIIIQAESININFPDIAADLNNNPLRTIDNVFQWVIGLRDSSFLLSARDALLHVYKIVDAQFFSSISINALAQITRELALLQMDCGEISGHKYAAIPLFLKASRLSRVFSPNSSIYDLHMLGVCAGIQGRNIRAINLFNVCKDNLSSGRRFRPHYAHILRDMGIALNRCGQYDSAKHMLLQAKQITENWHSEFNFAIDAQKLAIALAGCGEMDDAFRMLEKSSEILDFKDDLSYVKNLNAKHFFAVKCGDKKQASNLLKQIVEISDSRGYPHQKKIVYVQHKFGFTC